MTLSEPTKSVTILDLLLYLKICFIRLPQTVLLCGPTQVHIHSTCLGTYIHVVAPLDKQFHEWKGKGTSPDSTLQMPNFPILRSVHLRCDYTSSEEALKYQIV